VDSGRRVGIDVGTANTAAAVAEVGEAPRPVLFDGSEILPSAIWCDPVSRELLTGRDALHRARAAPDSLEPNPKRCVDDTTVLLGTVEAPVVDLLAAILRRVAADARWTEGDHAVLTCPAGWGPQRRAVLATAASDAGLGAVRMVAEPIAAAADLLRRAPTGAPVVVYDFGAGTFDASVVRQTPEGIQVLAGRGLTDVGGLDIDAVVADSIERVYAGRDRQLWQRLAHPVTPIDRRARLQWMQEVRTAKEVLSRTASTTVYVPLFDDEAVLGRDEFERIAGPFIAATVDATRAAVTDAGIAVKDLAAVLLVGGSSRIPLSATMIHRAFGLAPTVAERPELAVAAGSLLVPADAMFPNPPTQQPAPPPTLTSPPPLPPATAASPLTEAASSGAGGADPGPWEGRPTDPQPDTQPNPDTDRTPAAKRGPWTVFLAFAMLIVAAGVPLVITANRLGMFAGNDAGTSPPVSSSAPAPAVSATPSLTRGEIARDCLIGTWRVTDYGRPIMGADNRGYVARGGSGGTYTFRRDGTAIEDHPADRPAIAATGSSTYAATLTGSNTYRYTIRTAGESLLLDLTRTSGNLRLVITRDDIPYQQFSVPADGDNAVQLFTCTGSRLLFDDVVDTVLTRTAA
jgi:hypothetical protein